MTTADLTKREMTVLRGVDATADRSVRQLAAWCGIPPTPVHTALRKLRELGLIEESPCDCGNGTVRSVTRAGARTLDADDARIAHRRAVSMGSTR